MSTIALVESNLLPCFLASDGFTSSARSLATLVNEGNCAINVGMLLLVKVHGSDPSVVTQEPSNLDLECK